MQVFVGWSIYISIGDNVSFPMYMRQLIEQYTNNDHLDRETVEKLIDRFSLLILVNKCKEVICRLLRPLIILIILLTQLQAMRKCVIMNNTLAVLTGVF